MGTPRKQITIFSKILFDWSIMIRPPRLTIDPTLVVEKYISKFAGILFLSRIECSHGVLERVLRESTIYLEALTSESYRLYFRRRVGNSFDCAGIYNFVTRE